MCSHIFSAIFQGFWFFIRILRILDPNQSTYAVMRRTYIGAGLIFGSPSDSSLEEASWKKGNDDHNNDTSTLISDISFIW